jgi:hypothetical protein
VILAGTPPGSWIGRKWIMRTRILKGVLLVVAFSTLALTTGDAMSAASRQSAVVWLKEPTLIVSTVIQGPVVFTHDAAKMAKGEACTTVYLWEPGKTRGEAVASFHCIPTARKASPKFTLRTEPNLELGFGCILKEYQFAGDTEGHGVPSPPTFVEHGGGNDGRSF